MDIIKTRKYLFNVIKVLWVIAIIVLLMLSIFTHDFELDIVLGIILAILTFPIGLVVEIISVYSFIDPIINDFLKYKIYLNTTFLIVIIIGYYQWFIFIPKILAKDEQARLKELEEMKIKKDNQ